MTAHPTQPVPSVFSVGSCASLTRVGCSSAAATPCRGLATGPIKKRKNRKKQRQTNARKQKEEAAERKLSKVASEIVNPDPQTVDYFQSKLRYAELAGAPADDVIEDDVITDNDEESALSDMPHGPEEELKQMEEQLEKSVEAEENAVAVITPGDKDIDDLLKMAEAEVGVKPTTQEFVDFFCSVYFTTADANRFLRPLFLVAMQMPEVMGGGALASATFWAAVLRQCHWNASPKKATTRKGLPSARLPNDSVCHPLELYLEILGKIPLIPDDVTVGPSAREQVKCNDYAVRFLTRALYFANTTECDEVLVDKQIPPMIQEYVPRVHSVARTPYGPLDWPLPILYPEEYTRLLDNDDEKTPWDIAMPIAAFRQYAKALRAGQETEEDKVQAEWEWHTITSEILLKAWFMHFTASGTCVLRASC